MIKTTLYCALVFSLPCTQLIAANTSTTKTLNKQTSTALPAHKTTRLQWTQFPKPQYSNEDLQQQDRAAIIRIHADELGNITQVKVQESTGINQLDQILVEAVKVAKVKPYIENDTALATIGFQTFNLKYKSDEQPICTFAFNSHVWLDQSQGKKTPFLYLTQPELNLDSTELNGYNRTVTFKLKANKDGNIQSVKIKKGSGLYALDQKITQALLNTKVETKRSASTLWLFKKSHLKDAIKFQLKDCSS